MDANEVMATGHIMRCVTIANALRRRGVDVRFISADDQTRPYVSKENFLLYVLGSDWQDMDSEVDDLIAYLHAEDIHIIFVDSYQVSSTYFRRLKDSGMKIMYIDDLCKEAYPVDALLNYCPAAVSLGYEHMYGDSTRLCLGSKYIPLRDQFSEYAAHDGYGLLVTAGGSDSLHITDAIISNIINERGLGFLDGPPGRLHLLAGRFYEPSEMIRGYVKDGLLVLHQSVDNVAEIMSECRAAISSAGTTLFELSAVGVPTASFVFVDNQMTDALYFDREGLMPYIGDFRVSPNRCVERAIDWLYEIGGVSSAERLKRGRRLREMIDGHGAERIAEELISL